jgi:hypothetical protein
LNQVPRTAFFHQNHFFDMQTSRPLLASLFFVTTLLLACSPQFYTPAADQPQPDTRTVYHHGNPALHTNLGTTDVAVEMVQQNENTQFLDLNLFIRNLGDTALTFDPSQVRLYGFNARGDRRDIRIFTAREYTRHRNTRNAIIVGAIVVATAAIVVADARYSPAAVENTNRPLLFNDCWWLFSPTDLVIANTLRPPYAPTDGLLRRHTLYPDEALSGTLKARIASDHYDRKYLLEVPVGGGQFAKFVFESPWKPRR